MLPNGAKLTLDESRQLRDESGTIYAVPDESMMTDTSDRAGAGFTGWLLSLLPRRWRDALDAAAGPHDFKYSCITYQLSHPRSEADADLNRDVVLNGGPKWLGEAAEEAAEVLGGPLWEVDSTRNDKRKLSANDNEVE